MNPRTTILLRVFFFPEGDRIIAFNPDLNLSTFGDNEDEAYSAFGEAVDLFFEETQAMGTFDEIMAEAGFTCQMSKVIDTDDTNKPTLYNVPLDVLRNRIMEKSLQPV